MRLSAVILGVTLLLCADAPIPAPAQTLARDPFEDLPPAVGSRRSEGPSLGFKLVTEIPVPGPLPGVGPIWNGAAVVIPVAGGTAVTSANPGASLRVEQDANAAVPEPSPWVEDSLGRSRYRSLPGGWILAQRRCSRCKKGWKKRWKLRVPGNTVGTPLVMDRRVFFGALDNRIYCVKARNGHRVWVSDLQGRVSAAPVAWSGSLAQDDGDPGAPERSYDLVLVVPDSGLELVALSARYGRPVARVGLPEGEGKWVSAPLTVPDGRVVVARQRYLAEEASLMVYRLERLASPQTDPGNGPPDASPGESASDAREPGEIPSERRSGPGRP